MLKVAFICIHNSCRSQMAEAWAKEILQGVAEVYSAGTERYPEVKPMVHVVMEEVGIDSTNQSPKLLADIPNELDFLITMGCGVECPYIPATYREDWGLEDPSGGSIADFRQTRDLIERKVFALKEQIQNIAK